ncbi:MAG TPA: DUF1462 family protein [Bacilli bacterium]|nr:DUF1462 family protein [Bacilli bacterium]
MPSPVEVYEKLHRAVEKRYGDRVAVCYVDTDEVIPPEHEAMAGRILTEERWAPVIVLADEIISEGVLKLPDIWKALARRGAEGKE